MLTLISFVIGSIVGSFYNVCIYRLPNDLDVVSKSSFCTSCKYKIPFYLNIPIISYILNFGKCKNCKNKISISYLVVEVLTASLFVYAYMLYGVSFKGLAFIIFYSGLLIIFFTDFKYYLILDKITIPLSIVGLVFTFFNFNPFDVDILSSLIGGAVGYLVIYFIRFLFFKIRKVEGMGLGDAKLFLMVGIWLGIKSIYLILASSALVGAIVGSLIIYFYKKDKDFQIPYGCFIVIASALYPYLGSLFYNLI
ncbi:prepilin peptidase [Candidatus Pelagibacter sp.]|nr:prepilin peptidase [Candidatus Pelagibacter sp.]